MKRAPLYLAFLAVLFVWSTADAHAQWSTFTSEEFNIEVSLPDDWAVSADGDLLEASSPDESIALLIYPYKDESISTEELFYQGVDQLGFESEGEVEELEDLNGLHAYLGVGVGKIDDAPVGIVLLSATYGEDNYLAYIFTDADAFESHVDTMIDIITSLAPLAE